MRRTYDALGIACPPTSNTGIMTNQSMSRVKMQTQNMQILPGSVSSIRLAQPQVQGIKI